ncbi:MAG TPA: hypothetical protein ENI05_05910, partial [Porticoccus sp.]|nr:hypothetical protein [Porticoccus sp.]
MKREVSKMKLLLPRVTHSPRAFIAGLLLYVPLILVGYVVVSSAPVHAEGKKSVCPCFDDLDAKQVFLTCLDIDKEAVCYDADHANPDEDGIPEFSIQCDLIFLDQTWKAAVNTTPVVADSGNIVNVCS